MSSRQRGLPVGQGRNPNLQYGYGRRSSTDDREGMHNELLGDRAHLSPRTGGRDGNFDNPDPSMSSQQGYRIRPESNGMLLSDNSRYPWSQIASNTDETRARGTSMSSSPNRTYREDPRLRSGQSNLTASARERMYYPGNEYQPPQFPQHPFAGSRQSVAMENQEGIRSRPNSRTQSPIPPYPSTPPPIQHPRNGSFTPDQTRARGSSNSGQTLSEIRTTDNPYQLAPLQFSPPRNREDSYSLLAGTQFDELAIPFDSDKAKPPPAPLRAPPAPPPRHPSQSPRSTQKGPPSPALKESEASVQPYVDRESTDEEWTLDNVIEFLKLNGFGDTWQQAFRDADIHGEKFRACANYQEAKKLLPHEAHQTQGGRTLFKLITLIRKVLNPDSDTPDSDTSAPNARPLDRVQTAPPPSVNTITASPESPLPQVPKSVRQAPRQHPESRATFGPPPGRHEPPPPKLQAPPPARARSPQDTKRPLSPNVAENRQQSPYSVNPINQSLTSFNRHSKNVSNDSVHSDASLRSGNQPARSSQDFQDMLRRIGQEGVIAPQKRIDKKKSHEQISKPGLLARFFGSRDKSKDISVESDDPDPDRGPMSPPMPPQPPYNKYGMNNSQSSLDSSSLSTPIDEARPASLTTSISSLPSARPPSELSPPQYAMPSVLWVQVTQDEDNFKRCDLSNVGPDPAMIRERLCQKFGLKSKGTTIFVTELFGTAEDATALDDDALLNACAGGDAKGTLKFLLKPEVRKPASSPGKLILPPQALRPAQGAMLTVPDANKDGRDLRSTSISEDPNRKGYYNTTPLEMYGSEYGKTIDGNGGTGTVKAGQPDYFTAQGDELAGNHKDDVNTRMFEAADRAKKNRVNRSRTASGGSENNIPLDEAPYVYSDVSTSPGPRRRPSGHEDPGFEKLWGAKVITQPTRQQPTRQGSLPVSPASAGSFRVISKEPPFLDFSQPRPSPYSKYSPTPEKPPVAQLQQLPTRTPSGIKAQRRAPAPPQFPLLPSRTATVVATQRNPENTLGRGHTRRLSDSQSILTRRSTDDDRFARERFSEFEHNNGPSAGFSLGSSAIANLVKKSSFAGSIITMAPPTIVTPKGSPALEPTSVPPKRAPSPGTPGARLGISVDTNLTKNIAGDSPPTEWQSSMSPYSELNITPAQNTKESEAQEPTLNGTGTTDVRFKESANISFDDAPAFDLPDDDDDESLWAVKPIGVEDKPIISRKSSEDKGSPPLQKKSSLRKSGSGRGNRPPLTVQIDPKVTEIPTAQFSAIAEEFPSIPTPLQSSAPSSISSNGDLRPSHRAESPEYTIGDDRKGLNSPMRVVPPSPNTPTSASSGASGNLGATDLTRKNSFAKHEDIWAVRPPPDVVFDNLEEFFPNHDLDKPILVDHGNSSPPVSPMDTSDSDNNVTIKPLPVLKRPPQLQTITSAPAAFPKPAARMKSIRVVAKEAIEKRSRLASIAKGVKGANLLRRRSTKVWGARMMEMTPGQVRLGQIVSTDNEDGLERKRTFKWVKGELIGKGTYGSVYLGLNATTGEMLAVKQVDVCNSISDRDDDRSKTMMDALNAEIETLKDLDHPHIVQYLGYERTEKTISIFLEYVPGGSVGRCLKKHGRFEEKVIRSLIRQTLEGLAYLHAQGRLHRDLKADNLLLDLDGVCKISDFGISKQSKDVYANDHYTLAGTIFWMAPEVIQSRKEGYSAKIDIWSLGCVVLEMFAGKRPWSKEEAIGAMFKLGNERKAPPIPDDVKEYMSPDAKDFLDKCFTIEADKRPTAAMLLNHPFTKHDSEFNFSESKLGKAVRFGQK